MTGIAREEFAASVLRPLILAHPMRPRKLYGRMLPNMETVQSEASINVTPRFATVNGTTLHLDAEHTLAQ